MFHTHAVTQTDYTAGIKFKQFTLTTNFRDEMLISLLQAWDNRKNYFQHSYVWPFNYTHHMQQLTCVAPQVPQAL